MDIIGVAANGYCAPCWNDRAGCDMDVKNDISTPPHAAAPPQMSHVVGVKGSDVYNSSGNPLVDLYTLLVRGAYEESIRPLLTKVVEVSEVDAFVLAFQTRDIRGGKGERKLFQTMLRFLYEQRPALTLGLLELVPEYGCWGDLFDIGRTQRPLIKQVLRLARDQLKADRERMNMEMSVSLCAKWAPREKSNPVMAKALADVLFPAETKPSTRFKMYRKLVASLNRYLGTTEIAMCARRFADIQPEKVPGICLAKNMRAFLNETMLKYPRGSVYRARMEHDLRYPDDPDRMACREHFQEHMAKAVAGCAKVNGAVTRYPHQVIKDIHAAAVSGASEAERNALIAVWNDMVANVKALGGLKNSIVMCDFSGSMQSAGEAKDTPYWVSMAMGLLMSEVTSDDFKDTFLTFDSSPTWHTLPKGDIFTRLASITTIGQGTSTDFQKAMDLVLETLKAKRVRYGNEPSDLIVVTDMGWDAACGSNERSLYTDNSYRHVVKTDPWQTHIQMIQEAFRRAGEDMWGEEGAWTAPRIVIWNVAASTSDFHAQANEDSVIMLSGWSPSVFKVLTTEGARVQNPLEGIRAQLDDTRYDAVRARLATLTL